MNKVHKKLLTLILIVAAFIRLWNLNGIPVSLFGDELDVGYHAYSLLNTGRDYSGNFLPLHLQSLAEWRTPLYLYSVVPTVAIWGIGPLGVRIPAAIFGILGIWGMYLLVRLLTKKENLALLSALVLTLSPWHIQYSRAAFEVTMLLAFLIFGVYFFFRSLKEGNFLWVSATLLVTTPLIYSTAKLFTPVLLIYLLFVYRGSLLKLSKKYLIWGALALLIFGLPTAYSTLFGGGSQRFGYVSVFTDPVTEPEVGALRLQDFSARQLAGGAEQPTFIDRALHNKYTLWTKKVTDNYLTAFSTQFLFIEGDPNPRHSIKSLGQFYKFEAVLMLLGIITFFALEKDTRLKLLITLWTLAGVLPSAITRDGGNHATRLILMLPSLVFLIAYGTDYLLRAFKGRMKDVISLLYIGLFVFAVFSYQHNYRLHYPLDSEEWWHAGWGEAIFEVKEREGDYERVFITMRDEPAWIFFAGHYKYPPDRWHEGFPMASTEVEGFGGMSYIDKFHFGSPKEEEGGIYALNRFLQEGDLYLASAKEIPWNLIIEKDRVPTGLKLLDSVAYPSGAPAFYLFERQ